MNKTYLMLLCAGMLFCNNVSAKPDKDMPLPPPEHQEMTAPRHHRHKKIADELNLSKEQKAKAKEMRKATQEKIKPLMEEMKKLRHQIDEIRKENMVAFENILTPEQKVQFDKIKKERKPRHKKPDFKHMPPMPME